MLILSAIVFQAEVPVQDRSLSTSPLSLTSTEEEVDHGPHHCIPCNLVFLSALYLQRHLSSKAHDSVIAKIVDKKTFNCFLCGKYFTVKQDFRSHIESNLHKSFMRSNGVSDFIEDCTELADKEVTDFVIVDEVGEDEGDDVLEEISSDDEANETPKKPPDLEEVDSPEHDFTEEAIEKIVLPQPVRTSDPQELEQSTSDPQPVFEQELEDIHSDEDEIPLTDSEPEQVPETNAGEVQLDNLEEIHSDEDIDEIHDNSEPVINNESLESVSSPESPKSPESKSSDPNDLAFVDTIEFIYD